MAAQDESMLAELKRPDESGGDGARKQDSSETKDRQAPPPRKQDGEDGDNKNGGDKKENNNQAEGRDGDKDKKEAKDPNRPSLIRRHPLVIVAGIVVLIAAGIGGWLWWQEARHFETTDDAFIAARQFSVSPKVAGYITSVPVTDNEIVEAGQTLAVIDDRDYRTSIAQVEAQLAQAQAQIPNVDAQIAGQQAQIVQAEDQIKDARASLTLAEEENARYQQLAASGSGTVQRAQQTRSQLLQAQAGVSKNIAALNAAQKQLQALQAQRLSAEATVQQWIAQRDQAKINLNYTVLKADQRGRIVQLTASKGQYVQTSQTLMTIVPYPLWVVANFRETQIEDMKTGQPVDIRVDAYAKRVFKGHIDSIQSGSGTAFSLLPAENATGNYIKVVQRVPVKIVFDEDPDVVLGPGMSVVPKARVR